MGQFRKVEVSFWQDPDMLELTPETKYFYLYLLTNPHTTLCGIYQISMKIMMFETGYNSDTIEKLIQLLEQKGKIVFDRETKEVFIVNWLKYNWSSSPKVVNCIIADLKKVKSARLLKLFADYLSPEMKQVLEDRGWTLPDLPATPSQSPDTVSIEYPYSTDRVSIQYPYSMDRVSIEYPVDKDIDIDKDIDRDIDKEKDIAHTNVCVSSEESEDATASDASPPKSKKEDRTPYKKIVELYHELCPSLPQVKILNETRKRLLRARWREHPDLAFWEQFFRRVEASDFLCGRIAPKDGRPPFIADFEWIIRPSNFVKIIEGRYDNRKPPSEVDEMIDQLLKKWGRV